MKQEEIVEILLQRYESIFEELCSDGKPEWAVRKKSNSNLFVYPTIPFVGKNYFEQDKKILIYASAENLSSYNGYLDDDDFAKDRHRQYFSKPNDGWILPRRTYPTYARRLFDERLKVRVRKA